MNVDFENEQNINVAFSESEEFECTVESSSEDISFENGQIIAVGFENDDSFDCDFGGAVAGDYTGITTVTPSNQIQVLPTEGKTVSVNITVNPIPSNYGLITYNGSYLTVS